jgi:predicted O-methyltransferase YrrM
MKASISLIIPEVGDLVRAHYEKAKAILEFGSGGSNVMASEMPGKAISSVESSRVWTKMMRRWFEEAQPVSLPQMRM